jgi:hypothetical protein
MALRIDDIDGAFELLEWIRSFELIGLALDRMACPSFGVALVVVVLVPFTKLTSKNE